LLQYDYTQIRPHSQLIKRRVRGERGGLRVMEQHTLLRGSNLINVYHSVALPRRGGESSRLVRRVHSPFTSQKMLRSCEFGIRAPSLRGHRCPAGAETPRRAIPTIHVAKARLQRRAVGPQPHDFRLAADMAAMSGSAARLKKLFLASRAFRAGLGRRFFRRASEII